MNTHHWHAMLSTALKACSHGDVLANWMRIRCALVAFTLWVIICKPNRIESNVHWASPHRDVVWKRIQSESAIKGVGEPGSHVTILKIDNSYTAETSANKRSWVAPRSLGREREIVAIVTLFVYWRRNASTFLILLAVVKLLIIFVMHWWIKHYSSSRLKGSPWAFCIAISQVRVSTTWLQHAWQLLFTSYITWYDSLHPLSCERYQCAFNSHCYEYELDAHQKARLVWTRLDFMFYLLLI